MKNLLCSLILFSTLGVFAQSINNFGAVIVPLRYEFMKTDNQYRLATATKANLQKAGFVVFYANQDVPTNFKKCDLLLADVKQMSGFLVTKLSLQLKDCFGKVIFESEVGKSKEKDFQLAYAEALNEAFLSVYKLNYIYVASIAEEPVVPVVQANTATIAVPAVATNVASTTSNLLYAQPTNNGFNLIDSDPKIVFKLLKTSQSGLFLAAKGTANGIVLQKNSDWFFEYYQNEQLLSEKLSIKF